MVDLLWQIFAETVRANSFLLSMASPVLYKMMTGNFREGMSRR